MLACDHTFCASCCETLVASAHGGEGGHGNESGGRRHARITCPTCQTTTALPEEGGVSGLRTNKTVLTLLEVLGDHSSTCSRGAAALAAARRLSCMHAVCARVHVQACVCKWRCCRRTIHVYDDQGD